MLLESSKCTRIIKFKISGGLEKTSKKNIHLPKARNSFFPAKTLTDFKIRLASEVPRSLHLAYFKMCSMTHFVGACGHQYEIRMPCTIACNEWTRRTRAIPAGCKTCLSVGIKREKTRIQNAGVSKPKKAPRLCLVRNKYRWVLTALGEDPQSRLKHTPQSDQIELMEVDEDKSGPQASDQLSHVEAAAEAVPAILDSDSPKFEEEFRFKAFDQFSIGESSNSPLSLPRLPELDQSLSDIQLIIPSESEELFGPERQRRESFERLLQLITRSAPQS